MAATTYNANPTPQSGSGIFGAVPGQLALPNPYQDVGMVYPGLQQTQNAAGSDVLKSLEGQLSPETLAQIQNQGAAWGVQSGMPGSGVNQNYDLGLAAKTSMTEQQQGQKQYQGLVGTSSQNLTLSPDLQTAIAQINSVNAAAPDPTVVGLANIGSEIAGLGWSYAMNSPGGGSGGGSEGPTSYGQPDIPMDTITSGQDL